MAVRREITDEEIALAAYLTLTECNVLGVMGSITDCYDLCCRNKRPKLLIPAVNEQSKRAYILWTCKKHRRKLEFTAFREVE